MAKRKSIPSKELQLALVGPTNWLKIPRAQNINLSTDVPSTTVDEIGSSSHAGQSKDTPNVTLSFSAYDTGIKIFSVLTGTDWTAYPAAGVDISSLGEVDAIIYVKDAVNSDYVKSAHARRLQVRDMNLNYSVDGESTEDYTMIGSVRRWFKYDVVVDRFVSGTTSFTLSQSPIQLRNENYALSVILDGEYLTEVTTAPATGEYRIVGTTLTTGDTRNSQVVAVYHANPAGNNWSDISDSSMPAAIRGKDVYTTISTNGISRVQSISITATLNSQPVNEMGNPDKIVGYQSQVPEVTGTITVLDTDTELIELLTYGVIGSGLEWNTGAGCVTSPVDLKIELKDPCDTDVVLKTVYLDEISPIGDGYTLTVNQNAQWAVNFRSETGHLKVYSGEMV